MLFCLHVPTLSGIKVDIKTRALILKLPAVTSPWELYSERHCVTGKYICYLAVGRTRVEWSGDE